MADIRPRESLGPIACGLLGTTVSGLLAYGSSDTLPTDLQNVITSFVTASAGMVVEFYTGLSSVVCYVPAVTPATLEPFPTRLNAARSSHA